MHVQMMEGYSRKDLIKYIKSRLGGVVWRIEGFEDTDAIEYCIDDAVMSYSHQCPHLGWEPIGPFVKSHKIISPRCLGVLRVDFIEPVNRFAVSHTLIGLTQNLIGVAPINIAGSMPNVAGDIVQFLTWRKSFQRVTSTAPQWVFDDETRTVAVYNPGAYKACAMLSIGRTFETVKPNHKDWIKEMSLANAKLQLGIHRRKFNDSIKGPGGTSLNMDGGKLVEEAEKKIDALKLELRAFRTRPWPLWD